MTFQPDAGLGEPVPRASRRRSATLMPGFAAVLAVLGLALACCGFVNGMTYDVGGGSNVRVTLVFSAFSPAFIMVVAAGLVALSNMFTGARGPAVVSLGLSLAGLAFTVYIFAADYTHEVSSAAERSASPPVNMSPGPGGVLLLVISALMAVIALLWVFLIGSADRVVAHAATPAGPGGPMFPPPAGAAPQSPYGAGPGSVPPPGAAGGPTAWGAQAAAAGSGSVDPRVQQSTGVGAPPASHSPPSPAVQQRIPTGDEPLIDGDGDTTVTPRPPTAD